MREVFDQQENAEDIKAVEVYGEAVGAIGDWEAEDNLKPPMKILIETLRPDLDAKLERRTEVGTPDVTILHGEAVVGHVELKNKQKSADPTELRKSRDREQWERFRRVPNIAYCNGNRVTLWRDGEPAGAASVSDAEGFARAFAELLSYVPSVPSEPEKLAKVLARRARFLRSDIFEMYSTGATNPLRQLYDDWRKYLLPDMDESGFVDAFVQTTVAGLLLARAEQPDKALTVWGAVETLKNAGHELLRSVLGLIATAEDNLAALKVSISSLVITVSAVDPKLPSDDQWWVRFFEPFIKHYDPRLREDMGVFYTRTEIVDYQLRVSDWALRTLLGKSDGFASRDVVTLDPACGTGTYLVRLLDMVAAQNPSAPAEGVSKAAEHMYGFELMVSPYAISQLRLKANCASWGSPNHPTVLLTDTLSSTGQGETPKLFGLKGMAAEQKRAAHIKDSSTRVTVVIGNPPYDRESKGESRGGIVTDGLRLINDFKRLTGPKGRKQFNNIREMATYFWRWATWKVCEQEHPGYSSPGGPGIVCFITPSAFLTGNAWEGMRSWLRTHFDFLWVLDLGGDMRSGRDDGGNVLDIKSALCVTLAVRLDTRSAKPAEIKYRKVYGSAAEKRSTIASVTPDGDGWETPPARRINPLAGKFTVAGPGAFFREAEPEDVLPWNTPGAKWHRKWPIGLTPDVLHRRWDAILKEKDRKALFYPSGDRDLGSKPPRLKGGTHVRSIGEIPAGTPCYPPIEYSYRPFDTRWVIPDSRLGDRISRPPMWKEHSPKQAYLITYTGNNRVGKGPAAVVHNHIPDVHSFKGSAGGTIFPLWKDHLATLPNADPATCEQLSTRYEGQVTGGQLWHYCAGLLGTAAYTERWHDELDRTPPLIPFPGQHKDFDSLVKIGGRLVETARGQNLHLSGVTVGSLPQSALPMPISAGEYDPNSQTLTFDSGLAIENLPLSIWEHRISGYLTLQEWIRARKRFPKRTPKSPLETIRPTVWTFTSDLVRVCNQIATLNRLTEEAQPILSRL